MRYWLKIGILAALIAGNVDNEWMHKHGVYNPCSSGNNPPARCDSDHNDTKYIHRCNYPAGGTTGSQEIVVQPRGLQTLLLLWML